MQLEIRNFLTLSTGHVTGETAELLNWKDPPQWPVVGSVGEHGWFLYAHERNEDLKDVPEELWAIFELARANNCFYVLFDCDGPQVDGLPFFNW